MSCAPGDPLDLTLLQGGLETRVFGRVGIEHFLTTGSTNDVAKEFAAGGALEGTLVIAESQSKGRGRLGRSWYSPPGTGLYFSIVLWPQMDLSLFPMITLLAGTAVAQAVEETTGLCPDIKWPNDLLLEGKKVAGILTELCGELNSPRVILGIGINTHTRKEEFPPELREIATSLSLSGARKVCRTKLLQSILGHLENWYDRFKRGESEAMLASWRKRCRMIGSWAKIESGEDIFSGRILDIDEDGSLLLQDEAGQVQKILSGEILGTAGHEE